MILVAGEEVLCVRTTDCSHSSCVYELREKSLRGLRAMKDDILPGRRDVLWRERNRLTLKTGVKMNDDYLIYEDAIAEYLASGQGVRAVRLRMLVGELMLWETVSFQERYGWSKEHQRANLRRDMVRAGLNARLQAMPWRHQIPACLPICQTEL